MPERPDPRLSAARYRVDRETPDQAEDEEQPAAGRATPEQRAMYVETVVAQAIRRGDFDDLPGAGKPLDGLGRPHDPDWWIRRKIEREQLTGLGPPALTLRTEHAELEQRLDALASVAAVREYLEDFNRRVIEARRQLQGGPPVVTPTRDVELELQHWLERRDARRREREAEREREAAEYAQLSWRERRRRRRQERRG
ncbi:DnaJ family domain-containing protein [Herbiconiux sp. SYSU D00978]|uniref:DnaJ family domain-containing protein n=1 Tax=Herbiconiux sp. SYSU D00978 TaxID=2812562 RepID=UPI001A975170|nr:DUF1992 domain-containing protein [Herbiconiux sp. SYSU D00978]